MTKESPLRAQPDSRILAQGNNQYQGNLFDEPQDTGHEQLLADYRQRYGLAEDPFSDDCSFPFFTGGGRRQLIDRLLHLSQFSNSLLVILGDYGVGKTRTAHALMDSLSDDDGLSYLPIKARQTSDDLLKAIVDDLELSVSEETPQGHILALEQYMQVDPLEDEGLAVVVVDNAHLLPQSFLQLIVGLLQKYPKQNRLHIALFGEPSLMEQLESCDLEGVLLNDFYLQAFTLGESVDYLNFRMEMADYLGPEIFTEAMVSPWWRQAQGQLGVLHDFAQERLLETVTAQSATTVKRNIPVMHIVAITALITVAGILFLYMGDDPAQSSPQSKPKLTTSSMNLASTSTPVEPLMQSLPDPAAPAAIPSAATQASIASSEERIVPLAELAAGDRSNNTLASQHAPSQPENSSNSIISINNAPPNMADPVVKASIPKPTAIQPSAIARPEPVKNETALQDPLRPSARPKPSAQTKTAQEQAILGWAGSHFTIQLVGVSTAKAANDYVATQPNKSELLVFRTKRKGSDWFVVITGRYPSVAQARQAIASLPAEQRKAGPWPREIKVIQQEIKAIP